MSHLNYRNAKLFICRSNIKILLYVLASEQKKHIMVPYMYAFVFLTIHISIYLLTGVPSDHSQAPADCGSLLVKPTQNKRPSVLEEKNKKRMKRESVKKKKINH